VFLLVLSMVDPRPPSTSDQDAPSPETFEQVITGDGNESDDDDSVATENALTERGIEGSQGSLDTRFPCLLRTAPGK
jgi:hypothetical protein